jgi:hypothetical protein
MSDPIVQAGEQVAQAESVDPALVRTTVATLLEYWLTDSTYRVDPAAKPIVFRFSVDLPALSLVPAAEGPLVRDGAVDRPAATLTTHPAALLRLFTKPGATTEVPWTLDGDPAAFDVVARALTARADARGPWATRLRATTRTSG